MLKKIWEHCGYRKFSGSSWRNQLQKPPEPSTNPNPQGVVDIGGIPKEWEKRLLVMSGKYKRYEDVPPRVSIDTMGKAKSIIRIRVANIMMVTILVICFYYSYTGKQMAKSGDSIMKRVMERDEKVKAQGRAEAEARAQAAAAAQAQSH